MPPSLLTPPCAQLTEPGDADPVPRRGQMTEMQGNLHEKQAIISA